jgi:putative membrane protein
VISWHPHLDVWAFVLLLGGYFFYAQRYRPVGEPHATRRQKLLYGAGVVSIWLALDYPMHEVAENYLYSAHSLQHIVLSLVGPPLLMLGAPSWIYRRLLGRGLRLEIIRRLTRPLPALLIFNAVIAFIHWPVLVEMMSRSETVHILVHGALIGSAMLMWTPVLSPVLELPQLSYPGRMFYLFLQSIVPTVPASFLTFATVPFYRLYAEAPRLFRIPPLDDLQIAGLIMKIGGGFILWGVIAIFFFKWYALEQRVEGLDLLAWREVDRDLNRVRIDK